MDPMTDDPGDYFSDLAQVYAGHRPGYPPEAIAAAVAGLPDPPRVVDVGCGTGISSRLLAETGARVHAVDPNEGMLAEARRHPDAARLAITYERATAERLPSTDASADLVVCAQSFHWFRPAAALAEFHRVLAPGGRLALLWNMRETSDPFAAAYERVVCRAQRDAAARGMEVHALRSHRPDDGGFFANIRVLSFDNPQYLDRASLLGRIRSASYFPREGTLRDELEAELETQFARHARDGVVTLTQRTELTLADAVPR